MGDAGACESSELLRLLQPLRLRSNVRSAHTVRRRPAEPFDDHYLALEVVVCRVNSVGLPLAVMKRKLSIVAVAKWCERFGHVTMSTALMVGVLTSAQSES